MDIALIYMVAGLSSRFGGKIKQFARVGPNNETLIKYSLKQALPAGFTKIIFIVGNKTEEPFKEMFGNEFENTPIQYALQKFDEEERDKPWGTVDALCSTRELINCPFVVCNGDDIYGEETFKILTKHLKEKPSPATIGYQLGKVIPEEGGVNRGIFEFNPNKTIKKITETFDITKENLEEKKLSEETLCSMNIFALNPNVLKYLCEILDEFKEKNKNDRKIECLLPEEISKLIEQKKITMEIYPTSERWLGITNPEDEIKVREQLKTKIN